MNKLSGGKHSTVLVMTALVLALLFAVYYYVILPKQQERDTAAITVQSLQTEIASVEQQVAALSDPLNRGAENKFELHKKVPAAREVDSLLLNMEELEYVTDTQVQSIEFNNYDSLVSSSGLQDPNAPVEGEELPTIEDQVEEALEGSEEEEPPVSSIASEELPPALKLITLNLSVEAPEYANLLAFIKELERLERIVRIDTINYSLAGEELEYDPEASPLASAEIQVTTFYYEEQ